YCHRNPPYLHSFPTRRSSDLPSLVPCVNSAARSGGDFPSNTFFTSGCSPPRYSAMNASVPASLACSNSGEIGAGEKSWSFSEPRSEEHTSELQSLRHLVCRLL